MPLAVARAETAERVLKIVAFGDSLTAGYGVEANDAFPAVLERLLKAKGHKVQVINAGVSGDTTSGGLQRLDWAVPDDTDGVILELGANDMLRGQSPERARANLDTMIKRLKARGIPVLLAGMRASRNLGDTYANAFDAIYPDLAKAHDVILYPFFLDGVALDAKLNQGDGLHPNAEGVKVIADRMLPAVEALLRQARARANVGAASPN
ncbi:MAG: arylesterase [Hyphomicrobiaceae bacterium]